MTPIPKDSEAPAEDRAGETPRTNPSQESPNIPMGPRLRFDEHGHIIPPTEEEMRATLESLKLALEAMAAIPDDPPGSDEAFWRAIDAERPERPLFKELYDR